MSKTNIQLLIQNILPIIKSHPINFAALFGSFARGEQTNKSDLDIMVKFSEPVSYFDIIDIENKIAKKVKIKKVDLVTQDAIHPLIKKQIIKDLKVIYDSRR